MRALILVLPALAVALTGTARAAPPVRISPSLERTGHVDLRFTGPAGARLTVRDGHRPVGEVTLDAAGAGALPGAARWTCAHRVHAFVARGTGPDGAPLKASAEVTTPSCADRYRLRVRPSRPRAGDRVRVQVRDRFRLGDVHPRVCARGPSHARACGRAPARLRLARAGRWRLEVRRRTVRALTVRPPKRIRLLATGDSMVQIIDSFLAQRLRGRRVRVRSDAHISSGLSKPFFLNWPRHARAEVDPVRPDVTVMFIGANDGYPFGRRACCGAAWQRRYAQVAAGMMRTYAKGGGTVYWCLLPAPRSARFRRVFVAVNRALRRAKKGHPSVHLVDLPATLTPGYRFRQVIRWHGRAVSVRQPDGVHLNVAGASIAATLLIRRMARDGVL